MYCLIISLLLITEAELICSWKHGMSHTARSHVTVDVTTSTMISCVHRKQTGMWLLGDGTRSFKTKLEEGRAESHIISRMVDLNLSSAHMTQSSAHNSTVFRSPSSDGFTKVSHNTNRCWITQSCHLSHSAFVLTIRVRWGTVDQVWLKETNWEP